MAKYIVYNEFGEIRRTGSCPKEVLEHQPEETKEFVLEGVANDSTQKIEFDGLDEDNQPINPRIVDKTPEEIEADKPPEPEPIPYEQQRALITNKQWQDIQDRITQLEAKTE